MSILNTIKAPVFGDGTEKNINAEEKLAALPGAADLEWQSALTDLLTLVGVEPTKENCIALAKELNYSEALDGSKKMNRWVHKTVMSNIRDSGGYVPHPWCL